MRASAGPCRVDRRAPRLGAPSEYVDYAGAKAAADALTLGLAKELAGDGVRVNAARYVENESGSKLLRPGLFRLLADCQPGDVLLTEQVDRLSRLSDPDWCQLRAEIEAKQVRIVALDLPTSWALASSSDDFTGRMFAAVARKDYEDRRRRQAEGTAKAAGVYKGRGENTAQNEGIAAMLQAGFSLQQIQKAMDCSQVTIAKVGQRLNSIATETA